MIERAAYPGIRKAALEIALDNGGINRFRTQKQQERELNRWLAKQPSEILEPIDAWLSALPEDQLTLVCSGGQDEPETVAAKSDAPPFLDDILNSYFEEVC
jgi:hypothetical protein